MSEISISAKIKTKVLWSNYKLFLRACSLLCWSFLCTDTNKLFIVGQLVSVLEFLAMRCLSSCSPAPSRWHGCVKGGRAE